MELLYLGGVCHLHLFEVSSSKLIAISIDLLRICIQIGNMLHLSCKPDVPIVPHIFIHAAYCLSPYQAQWFLRFPVPTATKNHTTSTRHSSYLSRLFSWSIWYSAAQVFCSADLWQSRNQARLGHATLSLSPTAVDGLTPCHVLPNCGGWWVGWQMKEWLIATEDEWNLIYIDLFRHLSRDRSWRFSKLRGSLRGVVAVISSWWVGKQIQPFLKVHFLRDICPYDCPLTWFNVTVVGSFLFVDS